jgi:hypothetical protein
MPDPVTADDILTTAELVVAVLEAGRDADWSARAGDLDWSCWETVEHLADDWFDYAAQLGVAQEERVPFEAESRSPEGPPNTIRAEPEEGVDGLIAVCRSTAFLHAAVVRAAPPTARDHHVYGVADPEASAAMGVVEGLVHTHDVATGLGVRFEGDPELAARVLARLFPDVARTDDPWTDLLWATGRLDQPDRPRRGTWRWWNDQAEYKASL